MAIIQKITVVTFGLRVHVVVLSESNPDTSKSDGREGDSAELVVLRADPPEMFELVEERPNEGALSPAPGRAGVLGPSVALGQERGHRKHA